MFSSALHVSRTKDKIVLLITPILHYPLRERVIVVHLIQCCTFSKQTWALLSVNIQFRFEVLTAVFMKNAIFWDITPCIPLKINRRFGGTYRLHLQGPRINRARNQKSELCLPPSFTLVSYFAPEDRSDMILRNVG
jgi:hypothetical protein